MSFNMQAFLSEALQHTVPAFKRDYSTYLNLSSNELYSQLARERLNNFIADWHPSLAYTDWSGGCKAIAGLYEVAQDQCVVTPGSDAAIRATLEAVFSYGRRIIIQWPNYENYMVYALLIGYGIVEVPHKGLTPEDQLSRLSDSIRQFPGSTVVVANPNGFTGECLSLSQISRLAAIALEYGSLLLIDEAYSGFAPIDHLPVFRQFPNVALIRSYSKSLGAAHLRIASVFANRLLIEALLKLRVCNALSGLSLSFLLYCLRDKETDEKIQAKLSQDRLGLVKSLKDAFPEWSINDSRANFVLIDLNKKPSCQELVDHLESKHIIVKNLTAFAGFETCIRITVPDEDSRVLLMSALQAGLCNCA